jgi:hypothetical protein
VPHVCSPCSLQVVDDEPSIVLPCALWFAVPSDLVVKRTVAKHTVAKHTVVKHTVAKLVVTWKLLERRADEPLHNCLQAGLSVRSPNATSGAALAAAAKVSPAPSTVLFPAGCVARAVPSALA